MQYLIWLFTAALYSPVFYQLYHSRWQTIDYTHAYFILPVTLWLVWRRRALLKRLIQEPQTQKNPAFLGVDLGLIVLSVGIFMFIFGWRKDFLFVSTLSLIPVIFGLLAYLHGIKVAQALRFPILYLLLMVPPPLGMLDAITLPMRYAASATAYLILKSFYFPIAHDGLLLSIEGQQLYMGPACSGFRSLITMMSLGLAYVYLSKTSFKKKLVLLGFIVPLALFGNLIRILILCLIAYYFGEKAAQGFFHDFSGFVMFVVVLLGLLAIESILHTWSSEKSDE